MAEARIDKWLWASRIFKTRTIAAEACKKGRVSINGTQVKPSRMIKPGEVIQVKKPPVTYSFKVLQAIEKRIGAKLVPEILENVTTPEQYESAVLLIAPAEQGVPPRRTVAAWKNSLLLNISVMMTSTLNLISKNKNR